MNPEVGTKLGGYGSSPKKLYGQPVINYAISSHGGSPDIDANTGYPFAFKVPDSTEIVFYSPHSTILSCPNVAQTRVCEGNAENKVYEIYEPLSVCVNYQLSKDKYVSWKSGAVDCSYRTKGGKGGNWVVFDLESYTHSTVGLNQVVKSILKHHNKFYPEHTARIHCLFCRQATPSNTTVRLNVK